MTRHFVLLGLVLNIYLAKIYAEIIMEVGSAPSPAVQREPVQQSQPQPRQETPPPREQAELANTTERPAPDPNARVGSTVDTFV